MSRWQAFTAGWQFRTATPGFEPGQTLNVTITGYDADRGTALARVGDTILDVTGPGPEAVDRAATIRITSFDAGQHRGQAEYLG